MNHNTPQSRVIMGGMSKKQVISILTNAEEKKLLPRGMPLHAVLDAFVRLIEVRVCVCVYMHMWLCIGVWVYACCTHLASICLALLLSSHHTHTHTHTHTLIRTLIHTHIHTHTPHRTAPWCRASNK
jgi:hypothetical protein